MNGGRHIPRAAAMRRHPAGKARPTNLTATIIPFPRATIDATATATITTEKGTDND